ncbi:MAG: 4Fe-4S dicluster domain-containing protein [Chloroflexota bacterium]
MEQNVTGYLIYLLPLALVLFFYLRRHRKKEQHHVTQMKESVEAGLTEPASLHPVFDPIRCIGSGACVTACPEQAIGLIKGKGHLVKPTVCIGHGACMAACPHDAITLVFGTAKRGLDIPRVNPNFETNVPGIFIAGELGGMGLTRKAVEQGRQAMESIRKLKDMNFPLDVVIVGAGPAWPPRSAPWSTSCGPSPSSRKTRSAARCITTRATRSS